jgi:hypothetical protein
MLMPPLGRNIFEEPVAFIFHMKDGNTMIPKMLMSYVHMRWFSCDWILFGVLKKEKPDVTNTSFSCGLISDDILYNYCLLKVMMCIRIWAALLC